jgi:hypothetical protein
MLFRANSERQLGSSLHGADALRRKSMPRVGPFACPTLIRDFSSARQNLQIIKGKEHIRAVWHLSVRTRASLILADIGPSTRAP